MRVNAALSNMTLSTKSLTEAPWGKNDHDHATPTPSIIFICHFDSIL